MNVQVNQTHTGHVQEKMTVFLTLQTVVVRMKVNVRGNSAALETRVKMDSRTLQSATVILTQPLVSVLQRT